VTVAATNVTAAATITAVVVARKNAVGGNSGKTKIVVKNVINATVVVTKEYPLFLYL
jgi:hypothetical protein